MVAARPQTVAKLRSIAAGARKRVIGDNGIAVAAKLVLCHPRRHLGRRRRRRRHLHHWQLVPPLVSPKSTETGAAAEVVEVTNGVVAASVVADLQITRLESRQMGSKLDHDLHSYYCRRSSPTTATTDTIIIIIIVIITIIIYDPMLPLRYSSSSSSEELGRPLSIPRHVCPSPVTHSTIPPFT